MNNKEIVAKLIEGVARTTVKVAADSRCMFIYHQPKQPEGLKKFWHTVSSFLSCAELFSVTLRSFRAFP